MNVNLDFGYSGLDTLVKNEFLVWTDSTNKLNTVGPGAYVNETHEMAANLSHNIITTGKIISTQTNSFN